MNRKTEENCYDDIKKRAEIKFNLNCVIATIEINFCLSLEDKLSRIHGRKLFIEDREGSRANVFVIFHCSSSNV